MAPKSKSSEPVYVIEEGGREYKHYIDMVASKLSVILL